MEFSADFSAEFLMERGRLPHFAAGIACVASAGQGHRADFSLDRRDGQKKVNVHNIVTFPPYACNMDVIYSAASVQ